jgi:glutathione S-transferase
LIPAEPKARARTIWFEEFHDTIMMSCSGKMFFNRIVAPRFLKREGDLAVADKAEKEELPPILDYLESVVPESGFLVEDRLTLADISVASPFANYRHMGMNCLDNRPKLAAYVDGILSRPSFAPVIARETAFLERTAA